MRARDAFVHLIGENCHKGVENTWFVFQCFITRVSKILGLTALKHVPSSGMSNPALILQAAT